ncbi:sigma-70 family RNA polymerase sigma factor [bacterium]|nr:sigma-70 family RNA polymerase sigma factor [bacterium]
MPKHDTHTLPAPVDQQAFVLSAFDRFEPALTLYASRLYGGDLDAARDAVQQTFMKLVQQPIEQVSHKVAPWLYTVCRNWVFDDLKRRSRQAKPLQSGYDPVDQAADDPADQLQQQEFLEQIQKRIDLLPEAQRDVMELWTHGFNTKEIAEVLDRDAGTVRVQLHRSIKRLRQNPKLSTWLARATGQVEPSSIETAVVSSKLQKSPVKIQEIES